MSSDLRTSLGHANDPPLAFGRRSIVLLHFLNSEAQIHVSLPCYIPVDRETVFAVQATKNTEIKLHKCEYTPVSCTLTLHHHICDVKLAPIVIYN